MESIFEFSSFEYSIVGLMFGFTVLAVEPAVDNMLTIMPIIISSVIAITMLIGMIFIYWVYRRHKHMFNEVSICLITTLNL